MEKSENITINDYLKKIGFENEDIEYLLEYANNEIDSKILQEKIKYLISLGLDTKQIRIIIEEDITFVTEEIELIKNNGEVLKKYLAAEEIANALEVTPELLTMKENDLERNINLLSLVITDKEALKIVLQDRGEIVTYKPDYLSDKFSFLINNGLKENILKIIIENVEIFELDNDEIDLEELKF